MELSSLLVGILVVAWGLVVVSLPYTIYEVGRIAQFVAPTFERGKVVLKFVEPFKRLRGGIIINETIMTNNGRFKFLSDGVCLFVKEVHLFQFRLNTLFALKGKIEFAGEMAHVQARLPVGAFLCYMSWLVGCGAGGLVMVTRLKHPWVAIPITLVGMGFAAILYHMTVVLEKRRLFQVYEEIKQHLA
ncbi:MAG: hypothetical protein ACE5JU_21540 [Candidatus Binatia bacterium]